MGANPDINPSPTPLGKIRRKWLVPEIRRNASFESVYHHLMCGYDPGAYIKTVLFSLLITYYSAVWPQEEEPPVQQPRVARRDDERGSAGPMEPGRISTFLEFNRHKHDGSQPDLR
jgi:hypothetical protein